jgi:glucose uptake protein GlcU
MSFGSLIIGFIINIIMESPPVRLQVTGGGMLWTIGQIFNLKKLGILSF